MAKLPFKISVLIFFRNERGEFLLMRRAKEPNMGCWSPIGGKLEMEDGESPFECAVRETKEEIGVDVSEQDLHLFSMVSERGYEGSAHWLMFLFDCSVPLKKLPDDISEGAFSFFSLDDIKGGKIGIPETDRKILWGLWKRYSSGGMAVLRADCSNAGRISWTVEQTIKK